MLKGPDEWLSTHADRSPDRRFLLLEDGSALTYGHFDELVAGYGGALRQAGVKAADRVVVQAGKSPEALALCLACLRIGAIYTPLNTAYTPAELEYFLQDADPALLVLDQEADRPKAVTPGVPVETLGDGGTLSAAARTAPPHREQARFDLDAPAAMLYTSGTTGRPKGAVLSRRVLASNAAALARIWEFGPEDVLLHALPIFHAHGLFISTNTVLAAGASMVFLKKFDAAQVMAWLPRCTVMMGVPTFYTRLLERRELDRAAVKGVRLFVSGSAPLLPETHRRFKERTGHAILERYGMTETLVISSHPYHGERRPGSVGFPLPDVQVRIADPATGEVLPAGEIGVIEVRGPNLFDGYWRAPDKTAQDMRPDGFFITGDLGMLDAEGQIHIVGRSKDLIISGGYNVYPKEVETEIDSLPGVKESAVVGVPHPDFGEGVIAIVIPLPGAELDPNSIIDALNGRLARYKQPKRVFIEAELPRNAMGKVQKELLRQKHRETFTTA